jgi:hypothetical protein
MNTCTLEEAPPATQPEASPRDTTSELPLGRATGVPDEPPSTRDDSGGGAPPPPLPPREWGRRPDRPRRPSLLRLLLLWGFLVICSFVCGYAIGQLGSHIQERWEHGG